MKVVYRKSDSMSRNFKVVIAYYEPEVYGGGRYEVEVEVNDILTLDQAKETILSIASRGLLDDVKCYSINDEKSLSFAELIAIIELTMVGNNYKTPSEMNQEYLSYLATIPSLQLMDIEDVTMEHFLIAIEDIKSRFVKEWSISQDENKAELVLCELEEIVRVMRSYTQTVIDL